MQEGLDNIMTWKSVNKVLAALGVLGTLAVVSGADFLDTFAMSLTSFGSLPW